MKLAATLPLGIDIGTAQTRVALLERDGTGKPRLIAVATRPTGDDIGTAIAAACSELATRESRCIMALGPADAVVRSAAFPVMRRLERARAARFEAARFVGYPLHEATVKIHASAGERCIVGVARRSALDARMLGAKRARLRLVAVDDTAFALMRAFPYADAIIDVGERATVLVLPNDPLPAVQVFGAGGRAFTDAVVASLGIADATAEERKRSVGLAGAGDHARDALVEQLATALVEHRATAQTEPRAIALAGNGARLAGFAEALERAVAIPVRLGALPADAARDLPSDVVRAASPDWGLAYGLALWETAA